MSVERLRVVEPPSTVTTYRYCCLDCAAAQDYLPSEEYATGQAEYHAKIHGHRVAVERETRLERVTERKEPNP